MEVSSIKKMLADLSQCLLDNMAAEDYPAVENNIKAYQQAIKNLVAQYPKYINKNELIEYLTTYQHQQQLLVAQINAMRDHLHKAVQGIQQTRRYIIA